MIEIILNGIEFGVVLTFLVGPVFFTIMQTSIERGFWRGVLVAFGVSISDILYVVICYFGLAQIMADSNLKIYMAYAGGGILIGFGLYHLLIKSRAKNSTVSTSVSERGLFRYVIKGFLINGMTPMVLFFWIGTVSYATLNFGYTKAGEFALFFAFLLGTVLSTDILKAYLADKLRLLVTSKTLRIMNIILGILLIFFGARLLLNAKTISFI
ncbi:MAG: LysE family transporter [Cyclobacteriaceae bacterium]|nr:LysE family transporter [Cyclobacteriaceae bacterium]